MKSTAQSAYEAFYFGENYDPVFAAANAEVARYFKSILDRYDNKLFMVDIGGQDLFQTYLNSFPETERQYHNCNTCKGFINKYGRLVAIDEQGKLVSAVWSDTDIVPVLYKPGFAAMARLVEAGKITGQFLSSQDEWGRHELGGWDHFALYPPEKILVSKRGTMSAGQLMAKRVQDFGTLMHGLIDYPKDIVAQAVNLLSAESLYRSEKVLGPAKFLLDLHTAIEEAGRGQRRRSNLIWRAVAGAPVGFCTPRSSMLGTLLDDIKAGKPVDVVARGFAAKMNPLRYQRPTAAPAAGNIAQAEKLVAQMGIAPSLNRRFARLDEIKAVWTPKAAPGAEPALPQLSVFSMLTPKGRQPARPELEAPAKAITFEKFRRTVLPEALRIDAFTGHGMHGIALVTAVDPDAPPIIQWDSLEDRNPVSWYVYPRRGGGLDQPSRWNLAANAWVEVKAITLQPSMWRDEESFAHQGKSAILILDGAMDKAPTGGSGLFPEILRSELHQVRATIEAFSRKTPFAPVDLRYPGACGMRVGGEGTGEQLVLVTTKLGKARYRIDRWD